MAQVLMYLPCKAMSSTQSTEKKKSICNKMNQTWMTPARDLIAKSRN
jgi:hypothetical protein